MSREQLHTKKNHFNITDTLYYHYYQITVLHINSTFILYPQSQFPVVDDAELKTMEANITSLTEKLKHSEDKNRSIDAGMPEIFLIF